MSGFDDLMENSRNSFAMTGRTKSLLPLLAASTVALVIVCFLYELGHPSCHLCDDENYRIFAQRLIDGGSISERMLSIRAYGYPVLLAPFVLLGRSNHLFTAALIKVAQVSAYLLSSWLLYRILCSRFSVSAGRLVSAGLLGNYLAGPYLDLSLTDAPPLTIGILALSMMLLLLTGNQEGTFAQSLWAAAGLEFLIGFGIMVGRANVHWLPALAAVIMFNINRSGRSQRFVVLTVALASFALAVSPQLIVNAVHVGQYTFLPTYDLSALQFDAGARYLKYSTSLGGSHPVLPYLNPWYLDHGTATLKWYIQHPLNGLRTVFYHFFGALDFDQLFPYVYDLNPWYRPLLFFYVHALMYWGVTGYILIVQQARVRGNRSGEAIAAVLIAVYSTRWCAVYPSTAVENRFSLPIITLFIPLALLQFKHQRDRKTRALTWAGFAFYLGIACYLSHRLSLVRVT